jgi:Protein of unknown function (DUF3224)
VETHHALASFDIKDWNEWHEQLFHQPEQTTKTAKTRVVATYDGDIHGEGVYHGVMVYCGEANASYVGFERITGKLGKRSGTFVLQHIGVFENGEARTTWTVVPGSGTSELTGLRGAGGYVATEGRKVEAATLDYHFERPTAGSE